MKRKIKVKKLILISYLLILVVQIIHAQQTDFSILTSSYLGQKPPGKIPELFAPEILVKPEPAYSNIAFTADGLNAYWCYDGLWFSKVENGLRTVPERVSFSKKEYEDDSPFISPDGRRLFFTSRRPTSPADTSKKENVWVVELCPDGWSEPRLLPPSFNKYFLIFTRINNKRLEDGRQDISLFITCKKKDSTWTDAVNLKEHA